MFSVLKTDEKSFSTPLQQRSVCLDFFRFFHSSSLISIGFLLVFFPSLHCFFFVCRRRVDGGCDVLRSFLSPCASPMTRLSLSSSEGPRTSPAALSLSLGTSQMQTKVEKKEIKKEREGESRREKKKGKSFFVFLSQVPLFILFFCVRLSTSARDCLSSFPKLKTQR